MWDTAAEAHAAFNDLPAALLVTAVLFQLLGVLLKKEALRAAGFWMLIAGAVGALAAVATGLRAEATIEHGSAAHMIMERHETLAITMTVIFVGLAVWAGWRGNRMAKWETPTFLTLSVLGALLLFYVGHLGGSLVFRYGAGVPTTNLEAALADRAAGHEHAPGEEHDHGPATPVDSAGAAGQASGDHDHPPGTPPHEH